MLTRRHLLLCTAMTGLTLAVGYPLQSWAQSGSTAEATNFIVKLGTDLVAIVNTAGGYEEKKARLKPLIESAVDVDGIARFCLGRFVRTATPAQLQEYIHLFHDVLLNNIGGKIGEFQGVTFAPTTTTQRDADILVGTLIRRPNQQPNNVQWVVNQVGGQPKVVDVVAEGTSLRLTQRSDYAAYLARNNNDVGALVAAMKQQVAR
jgi:phospholipid transport system substrate-binding protein